MNKQLIAILTLLLCATSCIKEQFSPLVDGSDGFQTISFSGRDFEAVQIATRSTLGERAERRMLNIYAMVFDDDADLVYSHYFPSDERKNSAAEFEAGAHGWTIEDGPSTTTGSLRMKAPNLTSGRLYLIANIADELFNLSSEALSMIKTESDLLNFIVRYNIPTTKRTGSFIMVGKADITSISGSTAVFADGHIPVVLERLDSKIEFRVAIVPGAETIRNEVIDGVPTVITQTIESFEPQSWQVINVPNSCYLNPKATDSDPVSSSNFFNGNTLGFEDSYMEPYGEDERIIHGFSFYMFENRQSAQKHAPVPTGAALPEGFSSYHYRDKRTKTASGSYTTSGDKWAYAPENSTYVRIEGMVNMLYEDAAVAGSQTLHSLAVYYVHLGDFASDIDDYDILRNTHYTYTINIHGVDNIQVEVEKDNSAAGWDPANEKESGATGEVFVSQEEVYIFDAHYGQRVFRFNAAKMLRQSDEDIQKLTWYVSTPFGHKGMPEKVGTDNVDITTGLDYKWVHFMLNSKDASYTEPHGSADGSPLVVTNPNPGRYCQINRAWPGSSSPELMDVVSFCAFLRRELKKYKDDPTNADPDPSKHHVFDSEGDLYVTVFVDEYYYDRDPTSDESRASLWHEFANEDMRTMHIMCNSSVSSDAESSLILSAVSIRQLSIQTIYDSTTSTEGWGSESNDEFAVRHTARFFHRDNERRDFASVSNFYFEGTPRGTSNMNGLYNSAHMWGLLDASNNFVADKPWSEHIDYSQPNESGVVNNFLRDDPVSETMRYACLSRNRDDNGNGIIDKSEVKWYAAALGQLQELYLGGLGLTGDARLYNIKAPQNIIVKDNHGSDYYPWREHVVSSTVTNVGQPGDSKYRPIFIWAEEGISTSQYGMDSRWNKPAVYSIRCVRNLDAGAAAHDMTLESDVPESIVDVTTNADGSYTFDFTRLNSHSKRPKVNTELLPLDENSSMSLVSNRFQTGDLVRNEDNSVFTQPYSYYLTIQDQLEQGKSICPSGYHVPNIREIATIYLYANSLLGSSLHFTCNYFSFGHPDAGGNGFDPINSGKKQYTWTFSSGNITIDGSGTPRIRCVRDL